MNESVEYSKKAIFFQEEGNILKSKEYEDLAEIQKNKSISYKQESLKYKKKESNLIQDIEISNSFGSYDMWIIRLSSSGELLWEKSFGGSAIDEGVIIIKNQDNNYTILGNTNSPKIDGFKTRGMNDFLLINLDSSGNILSKTRHGSPEFDYAKDMKQTKDGSYFIIGYSRNPENIQGINFKKNAVFLSQIQPNGIIQNTWKLNGSNEDLGSSISQLKNGSVVIVGTTESSDGDFILKKSKGSDIFVAILNE